MIKVRRTPGRSAAVLVCDVCHGLIKDAGMAAAVFPTSESEAIVMVDVLHAHKGACHTQAEERMGGKARTGWLEMKEHLYQVCGNSGFGKAALVKAAAIHEEMEGLKS